MYSTEYSVARNPIVPVIARKIALKQSTPTTRPAPIPGSDTSVTSGAGPWENVRTTTAHSATPAAPTDATLAHPLAGLRRASARLTSAPAIRSATLKTSRDAVPTRHLPIICTSGIATAGITRHATISTTSTTLIGHG